MNTDGQVCASLFIPLLLLSHIKFFFLSFKKKHFYGVTFKVAATSECNNFVGQSDNLVYVISGFDRPYFHPPKPKVFSLTAVQKKDECQKYFLQHANHLKITLSHIHCDPSVCHFSLNGIVFENMKFFFSIVNAVPCAVTTRFQTSYFHLISTPKRNMRFQLALCMTVTNTSYFRRCLYIIQFVVFGCICGEND